MPGERDLLDVLELSQPGKDGGKTVDRFQRRSYPNAEVVNASEADREQVLITLVESLLNKANHTQQTEDQVEANIAQFRSVLERNGKIAQAALLPENYKALMTMLKDSSGFDGAI